MENRMKKFISAYELKVIPLYRESNLASWNANISGTGEDWSKSEKASFELAKIFTDSIAFKELNELKKSGSVKDSLLSRKLDLLYNAFRGGQVDPALFAEQIKMETEISKKYSNFRAKINGKDLSDNQVEDILKNSTVTKDLQAAWEGHKMIGPVVAEDIIKLVKHRNTIARKIGFSNYHAMSLELSGQDPVKLVATFYDGIGLNVDAILARSDLYEKPGKNQHAFSTDIDRSGDIRTLDNVRPDSYWMNTLLHELGHGVYSYYCDRNLPCIALKNQCMKTPTRI
jgi:oligoendopeptidase F